MMTLRGRSGRFFLSRWSFVAAVVTSGATVAAVAFPLPAGRARAYYLYCLAQQAQFEKDYVRSLKFLEEAAQADDAADLSLELSRFYLTLSQYDQAESYAREAILRDPDSAEARKVLAQILLTRPGDEPSVEQRAREAEELYQALANQGTGDDETYLALAQIQTGRGDWKGAAATLEKFRSSQGFSGDVDLQLSRIYAEMGKTGEAVSLLRGLLAKDPNNADASNALGNTLEQVGRFKESSELFRHLVEQNPRDPYARYRLGTALLALSQFPEAREELLLALKIDSGNPRVLLALGQTYEGSKQLKQAEAAYQHALSREPTSLEARFFLARVHQSRAEDDQALELYRQILTMTAVGDSPSDRGFASLANSQVGVIHFLQRDYPPAIDSVRKALQTSDHPTADLFSLLAQFCLTARRSSEARQAVAEGLKLFPDDPELLSLRGEIPLREGRGEDARKEFRSLLKQTRESEAAYLSLLQSYYRAKKFREVEPWLKEALRKHPGSRDLRFQSAVLQERLGRFREAERQFRAILRADPDSGEALNYLGYMLADRGEKLHEALSCIQKAVGSDPGNAAYVDSLGWVYYRLGDYGKAESYLEEAAKGSRKDPTVYDHLGDTRVKMGRIQEALEAYRIALGQEAENPDEIRKKIRRISPGPEKP